MNLDNVVSEATRFAEFASKAIPVLLRWWNDRKDAKLEEQLLALDEALGHSFDDARARLAEKYGVSPTNAPEGSAQP